MRQVTISLDYLTIEENIALIDEPVRGIFLRILADHRKISGAAVQATLSTALGKEHCTHVKSW